MNTIISILIGGLVLFIFAINQLSEVLREMFSSQTQNLIARYAGNLFVTILIGALLTVFLDSSSAVIIVTIILVNAKTLTFRQAMGIVMGANIGTTAGSQLIALDIGKYSIIPLVLGLGFEIFAKNEVLKKYGRVALYFGMLFFGLFLMEESVMPLKESSAFEQWIKTIENNYIYGALLGGLITVILQSSSATVGMAIVLGKQKLITIAGGIAVMIGAELGTCSNTLIATIKGSRQAIKTGIFHLIFNLTSIIVGLIFFHPFVKLVQIISQNQGIDNQIANAHILFNLLGVLIFLPFVGLIERLLNYLLPDE